MTDLEALKARHPILEVARDLGLEVNHNRFRCPHPERHTHGDRTASVTLWPDRNLFKCWVCPDVKGDVLNLIQVVKGIGFAEAVAFLEKRGGYSPHPSTSSGHRSQTHTHSISQSQVELFQTAPAKKTPESAPVEETLSDEKRRELIGAFLELCGGVHGKAMTWLKARRIFKKTWDGQRLRVVENYGRISDDLLARFPIKDLRDSGLFNADGHLRFYRHPLILPYFDSHGPVYLQARALDSVIQPKELSLAGPIPCPYNARLLNGERGPIYLCEGVIDTLTLIEAGFPAVGIPGAANFKAAWVSMFKNKSVYVVFDADAAGEAGAAKTIAQLTEQGIEAHRLPLPPGKDINDWLRSGGLTSII